jgi:hypothetical protein
MTQAEIERTERLIESIARLDEAVRALVVLLAEKDGPIAHLTIALRNPSPGWRRMLDEFKGAVSRMPTSIRARF